MHFLNRTSLAGVFCFAAPFAFGIAPAELSLRLRQSDPVLVVDIRTAAAYAVGHIPGAVNIPGALLPYKSLPASAPIVICGDGLGLTDDDAAAQVVKQKPGTSVDILAGGYAGWLSETRLSTAPAGVVRERIPGSTYQQILAASKRDMLLVDVRTSSATAGTAQLRAISAAAPEPDVVAAFASKLGVPLVGGASQVAAKTRALTGPAEASTAIRQISATIETLDGSGKLLVLVADDEADANEAARLLRARGNYRFTVLIGGTEAIRYEGKIGSGRRVGNAYADQTQP